MDAAKRVHESGFKRWFARNWPWAMGLLALLFLLVFVLSHITLHPGYIEEDERTAKKLIEQFHERMNARQFNQIYDDYHETFKKAQSREVAGKVHEVRDQFGTFKGVLDSEMNVIIEPEVQVRAGYDSSYEKGPATELFGFLREGHKLQVAFYEITPGTTKLKWGHGQQVPAQSTH